jgi:hypothetical protein
MKLFLELLPLAIPVLGLLVYFVIRWRYWYTCPECGRWSRERADISFTYQASEREEPGEVKIPSGGCSCCAYLWTLKDTHVKSTGLVIPRGTRMSRPD